MIMFDALDAMVQILQNTSSLSAVSVKNYEPGDGMPDVEKMPAVFCYLNESDFNRDEGEAEGSQSHEPRYFLDVYVNAKATYSQSTGTTVFSVRNAHITANSIVNNIYAAIMDQTFRDQMETILDGPVISRYLTRIEKLGVAKYPETNQAIIAYRITVQIRVQEENTGYVGIALDEIEDAITPQEKE